MCLLATLNFAGMMKMITCMHPLYNYRILIFHLSSRDARNSRENCMKQENKTPNSKKW